MCFCICYFMNEYYGYYGIEAKKGDNIECKTQFIVPKSQEMIRKGQRFTIDKIEVKNKSLQGGVASCSPEYCLLPPASEDYIKLSPDFICRYFTILVIYIFYGIFLNYVIKTFWSSRPTHLQISSNQPNICPLRKILNILKKNK